MASFPGSFPEAARTCPEQKWSSLGLAHAGFVQVPLVSVYRAELCGYVRGAKEIVGEKKWFAASSGVAVRENLFSISLHSPKTFFILPLTTSSRRRMLTKP